MADIAFLLLIFWLVTTTIDSDEGIKRQLPPPVPPDIDVPQAKEQNVFNVKVNFLDQLLVEGEPLDLDQMKDKAKNFLIATGDGVMSHPVGPPSLSRPSSDGESFCQDCSVQASSTWPVLILTPDLDFIVT